MNRLPKLKEPALFRQVTDTFYGYDHNPKAGDGTWYKETGLCSDAFPVFGVRRRTGTLNIGVREGAKVTRVIAKDKLAWVEEQDGKATLVCDGKPVDEELVPGEKQLVSMGAYLCVFPDGVYVNLHDLSDHGRMENKVTARGPVSLTPCASDGTGYDLSDAVTGDIAPEDAENGAYWIDTSEPVHVLKRYARAHAEWVPVSSTYIRISAAGIGKGFAEYDCVRISGLYAWNETTTVYKQVETLNTDAIIRARDDDSIVIAGVLDQALTLDGVTVTVERRVPEMDFVCESENRLWGCRYGETEGQMVNTIYASAPGDCRNWFRYEGLASDSYAVSVGSDGPFTGITAYGGYVLAWKEDCVHRVYGSLPSNFTVTTQACRGVACGCGDSIRVVRENLYYMSRSGVCVYDGTTPRGVFDAFAGERYASARAGVLGSNYVVNMRRGRNVPEIWSYDTRHDIWHHLLDDSCAGFFSMDDDLLYVSEDGRVVSITGRSGELEGTVQFDAISGMIGYETPDRKFLYRIDIRVKMGHEDRLEILVSYDSDDTWESAGEIRGGADSAFVFPIIPRRCDHLRLRLRGRGDVRIFQIVRLTEEGTDAE